MNLHVGTSGYSYKEWKGNFYPEDLPAKEMLAYYSRRLPAVEINNTFYRLPQASMVENWRDQVPPEFRFSVKASQRITHIKRLKNFLALLPDDKRAAFEFRHASWLDDEVNDLLKAKNCALVVSDTDEQPLDQIINTASWGYLRLRRMNYEEHELAEWRRRVQEQKWGDAFVFF